VNENTLYAIIAILTLLLSGETAYIIKAMGAARAAKQHKNDERIAQLLAEVQELKENFSFLKK